MKAADHAYCSSSVNGHTVPRASCLPVQVPALSSVFCPSHQYSPTRCHNPGSRSSFSRGEPTSTPSRAGSSIGDPKSRHSRSAIATAFARTKGSKGLAAKGGTRLGGGAVAQAARKSRRERKRGRRRIGEGQPLGSTVRDRSHRKQFINRLEPRLA